MSSQRKPSDTTARLFVDAVLRPKSRADVSLTLRADDIIARGRAPPAPRPRLIAA